ncbi:MAG: DUF4294 domain-containing protein [Saprospiraceae bacterium]
MRHFFCAFLLGWAFGPLFSQNANASQDTTRYQGGWAVMEVVDGDTIYNMTLRQVRVSGPRKFEDKDEQDQYRRYQRAARKVYPFAVQAVELYWQIQSETEGMNKRKRKRHIRHEHKELKEDFKEQLKELSKTQGRVLIKMIERQIGKPFYEIITETRGGMTAVYWQNLGKFWGYDLKDGYREGADPLLDEVLLDYDFPRKIYEHWKG